MDEAGDLLTEEQAAGRSSHGSTGSTPQGQSEGWQYWCAPLGQNLYGVAAAL
jgi:hypothetical protein